MCKAAIVDRVTQEIQILVYADEHGYEPFSVWIHKLKDINGRKRIFTRIDRLRYGNYGDCEPVGEGVSELRCISVLDIVCILQKKGIR